MVLPIVPEPLWRRYPWRRGREGGTGGQRKGKRELKRGREGEWGLVPDRRERGEKGRRRGEEKRMEHVQNSVSTPAWRGLTVEAAIKQDKHRTPS